MSLAMFTSLLVLATLAVAASSSQQEETQGEVSSEEVRLTLLTSSSRSHPGDGRLCRDPGGAAAQRRQRLVRAAQPPARQGRPHPDRRADTEETNQRSNIFEAIVTYFYV